MGVKILQKAEAAPAADLKPRDRLLHTARDLFHQHGIKGIGVEAITEAAGTNKMTLYRHFGSKDDLIVECLQKAINETMSKWDQLERENPGNPKAQLSAWIEAGAQCIASDKRGCEIANAAVELTEDNHPGRKVIEDGKKEHRRRLVDLCQRAGLTQPELAADTLCLLFEGARISRQSDGAEGPSARFKRMADGIVAAYGDGRRE
ncbi:MAG: TetR/AcrR family transcriptional regulator [Pseudomonadota bacterium]